MASSSASAQKPPLEGDPDIQIIDVADLNGGKPTRTLDCYWIVASNRTTRNSQRPVKDNSGKWLIFEPRGQIDSVWETIKRETEAGNLGFASKVSTMKDKAKTSLLENYVICVYTYDHTDKPDVMRVRDRLKSLGFTRKLPYKTDEATYAGEYSGTTDRRRVSKYYA